MKYQPTSSVLVFTNQPETGGRSIQDLQHKLREDMYEAFPGNYQRAFAVGLWEATTEKGRTVPVTRTLTREVCLTKRITTLASGLAVCDWVFGESPSRFPHSSAMNYNHHFLLDMLEP